MRALVGSNGGWIMSGFDVSPEATAHDKTPCWTWLDIHFASRTEDQIFRDGVSAELEALQENGKTCP